MAFATGMGAESCFLEGGLTPSYVNVSKVEEVLMQSGFQGLKYQA